jgi:hypothetical protein
MPARRIACFPGDSPTHLVHCARLRDLAPGSQKEERMNDDLKAKIGGIGERLEAIRGYL